MESCPLFNQHIKYLESICTIQNFKPNALKIWDNKSTSWFLLWKSNEVWLVDGHNNMRTLSSMMKLFYMDKALVLYKYPRFRQVCCSDFLYDPTFIFLYEIDMSYTENKFYLMIFALTLTRSVAEVKKFRSDALEKYKLLKMANYFPSELSLGISSYLIQFILMCMM